jgi:hypothetical protein
MRASGMLKMVLRYVEVSGRFQTDRLCGQVTVRETRALRGNLSLYLAGQLVTDTLEKGPVMQGYMQLVQANLFDLRSLVHPSHL